jgi:hypothetical protein
MYSLLRVNISNKNIGVDLLYRKITVTACIGFSALVTSNIQAIMHKSPRIKYMHNFRRGQQNERFPLVLNIYELTLAQVAEKSQSGIVTSLF